MYYELTGSEFFFGTLFFFFVAFLIWKSRDANFLKERNEILKAKDLKKSISLEAKVKHNWWHNLGFLFIVWVVGGLIVAIKGFTPDSISLTLAVGSLFMIMDVVLNMQMKGLGWRFWHLGDGWFDRNFNWWFRFGLFFISIACFYIF